MNIEKYSSLPFNNLDAAFFIINDCVTETKDPTIGLDLGDQIAIFEVRALEEDLFYIKESLKTSTDIYVDKDTEGTYESDQLVELIIARLQVLDDLTDYPRVQASKKKAIEKAFTLLKYDPDQPRDEQGRFGSTSSGDGPTSRGSTDSRTSTATSNPAPKITTQDSQRSIKIDESKLPSGKLRDVRDRSVVVSAYKEKLGAFNKGYTIGEDKGAVWNAKWEQPLKAAPKDYPKDMPFNPRPQNAKVGDFSKEYQPFADKETMMSWMKEGDLGAHKASVALHELYAFARQRQGDVDGLTYGSSSKSQSFDSFMTKNGLTSFDVDIHHMIPASIGGSNRGPNMVALTPAEHTIAHVLEWSAAKTYKANGDVAQTGKWGGGHKTFEASGANIKANNLYRALTIQTTAAARSGNPKEYWQKAKSDPSRASSLAAVDKALKLLHGMNLVKTTDVTKLALGPTGRPKWGSDGKVSKSDLIKRLEASFLKRK